MSLEAVLLGAAGRAAAVSCETRARNSGQQRAAGRLEQLSGRRKEAD